MRRGIIQWVPLFCALIAYAPALKVGFLVEDHPAIEYNPRLDHGSWAALRADFQSNLLNIPGTRHYRPLLTLVNRIDKTVWGLHPRGFHVTSLLMHLACVWLGMWVLFEVSQSVALAILGACLFAVHPIGVHTQLIIMAREEPLSLMWSLAAILLALRSEKKYGVAACVCYGAALFAKESAVATPFLLALVFWARRSPAVFYRRAFVMLLVTWPYLWVRHHAVGPIMVDPDFSVWKILLFKAAPVLWWSTLKLFMWPWTLHYPHPMHALSHAWPFAFAGMWGMGFWFWRLKNRIFFWAWGWSILWLAPRLPAIVEQGIRMDHWSYPGALALAGVTAWCILWTFAQIKSKEHRNNLLAGVLALVIYFGGATHYLIRKQSTDVALHRWTLQFEPNLGFSLFNLGGALLAGGQKQAAIEPLQRYIELYHDDPAALAPAQRLLREAETKDQRR